mgnify:CR=1 FL=1|tara:strand:- start:51 stop:797 length:747 start_codon:yes stop_codon:yes gene_type:complete
MFEWIYMPDAWMAMGALIALEVVLGIDNIVFISILVARLPAQQRKSALHLGIGLAMLSRLVLLFSIVWVMRLVEPLFTVLDNEISGRDLILLIGGLFLLAKSTHEIHSSLELEEQEESPQGSKNQYFLVLLQIMVLDIIFSLDSVITAVGLVDHLSVMVIAILISVLVMLVSVNSINSFVEQNPTIKMLALSFLLLIGFTLIAEGLDVHIPKGYIYFAMAFSVGVEFLNLRIRKKKDTTKVKLLKKTP